MRKIELADDLKVCFPARGPDFDLGFEVGMIAVLMSLRETEFTRTVSPSSLDQCSVLAERLGYYVAEREEAPGAVRATFRSRRARPKLRLVSSRAAMMS